MTLGIIMDVLKRSYFNPKHPIAFAGVEKIYQWFKKNGYKLSRHKIENWLLKQEDVAVHKQPRRHFVKRRVISPYPGYMVDTDLADYSLYAKQNDGFKYFLLCIDVFTRFVWVWALRTKTSKEMIEAFKSIKDMTCEHLRSDKGKEYTSGLIEKWFKDKGIKHYVTQNETKANYSERAIKTIKKKIARYMSLKQTHRWIDILEDVVYSYNHSYHRSIQMSPADVTKKDVNRLWKLQYEPKNRIKKEHRIRTKHVFKFKVGDLVRVSALKRTFEREYDEKFTRELFVVTKRQISQGVNVYTLKDYAGEEITGTFYQQELVKAHLSDVYKIEKVLKKRKNEAYVRWLGWGEKHDSWIPLRDVKTYK